MAKRRKSFKSLPKRAKKAAFAKMTSAGTLKAKGKSGKRTGAAGFAGFPKHLQSFGKIAASSKDASDFINKARSVKASPKTSNAFFRTFGGGSKATSMYSAADKFIKASRRK